jgi:hypothetical protein
MAGSGGPEPNRIVTFLEVNFSPAYSWSPQSIPNPYDGFFTWQLSQGGTGSISITRSDGKVLQFGVPNNDGVVQIRDNVIRWTAFEESSWWPGSNGPFK